jgi:hypothetical protein
MQGLKVALSEEESKNSGLEGLISQSQGRLIKEENEAIITPYEIFEKMRDDLKLTEKDLLFLSATYLNYNIKYAKNRGSDMDFVDMKKYKPENYNQESFAKYKLALPEKDKAKLDFQIILYTIKSEDLIRDYELTNLGRKASHLKSIKNDYTYTDLVFGFIPHMWGIDRPNGEGFIGLLGQETVHEKLKKRVENNEITLTQAIDIILHEEYKGFWTTDEYQKEIQKNIKEKIEYLKSLVPSKYR